MMKILEIWRRPAERRRWITTISGLLIVGGLLAGQAPAGAAIREGLFLLATLIAGGEIAARAWGDLRLRVISIEMLVTIAAIGALIIGEVWEAAAVTFLFALGGYLEARTLGSTRKAIEALLETAPATAVVVREGEEVIVPAEEVIPGETVIVRPGGKVPVDGEVIQGYGAIDESAITGESAPAEKEPGAAVFAGTLNQGGLLQIRATGVGADTTLARIIMRVEEAQEARAPAQRFIERFARWYTPAILVLSLAAYLLSGDAHLALTLLVIGCPGALVISIPVSLVAGIGRAARDGILIKGGEHLERAARVSTIAFDKTGTLTLGKPRLIEVTPLTPIATAADSGSSGARACRYPELGGAATCADDPQALLRLAGIAENGSEHPLARTVVAEALALGPLPRPERMEAVVGRGIRAEHAGSRIDVGSMRAMSEWGIEVPDAAAERVTAITSAGGTPLLVAQDGVLLGVLGMADAPRADAQIAVRQLHEMGISRTVMLTGDGPATARAVADRVGIDEWQAGLLPDEKLQAVQRLQAEGEIVAMVGDGINDAPALARADVGVAMGAAGTDVAIETADIALIADDLTRLPRAIEIARRTSANMRQNVVIAVLTVAGLLAGVLTGDIHMAGGMLIHELSVLAVIANGMRLLR